MDAWLRRRARRTNTVKGALAASAGSDKQVRHSAHIMRTHLFLLTTSGTGDALSLFYTEIPILARVLLPGRTCPMAELGSMLEIP